MIKSGAIIREACWGEQPLTLKIYCVILSGK
ncbi:MAG: Uncharacterised protein [Glaciecola sp. HTCC2999]|nr:MAG: Uncharacterised protein [Glaciecola sp. HTCC2999]